MAKFNIDLSKVDNEAFKRRMIKSPAEELSQGVDPAQQLDESVARTVHKQGLSNLGRATDVELEERAQARRDLDLLLQDQNKPVVSQHIADDIEKQARQQGDTSTVQEDPLKYREAGTQLGEQFGQSGTTAQGQQVPWANPELSGEGVGIGPFASPRGPSLDQQRTTAGFADLRTDTSDQWINKFGNVADAKGRDIEKKSQGIDKFKALGDQAMEATQDLSYRLRGPDAVAFSERLGTDLGIDFAQGSVEAQYLAGFAQNFAQLEEQGMSQQLVDIMVAARLQHMKKLEWTDRTRQLRDQKDTTKDIIEAPAVTPTSQRSLNSENDEAVGRVVNKALGIQGDPEIDAVAGAMARGITNKAMPHMFQARTKYVGKAKEGSRRSYDSVSLSPTGLKQVNSIEPFLNIVLPGSSKAPRYTPTTRKSNITHPRKYDPSKEYGDYEFVNQTIDVLNNTPFSMSYGQAGSVTTYNAMRVLSLDPSFDQIIKIKIDPLTGQEREFLVDEKGEYVLDRFGQPKPYIANELKRSLLAAELGFAEDSYGKNVFHDHFFGSNNRFYVDSAIGNYQSSTIARSLLEAGADVKYDMTNVRQMNDLKAGIMKKFGFSKHNVAGGVAIFDGRKPGADVKEWQKWFASDEAIAQNAAAINEAATSEEGPMSISAMVEAVKLQNAIDAGRKGYTSKFLTEIDGVANGVAHNVMQAGGNLKIEKATNLFSNDVLNEMKTGEWQRGTDVYVITSDKISELLANFQGKPEQQPAVDWILNNFVDADGNSLINRDLGKKPMMIFGYGAGGDLIFSTAGQSVVDLIGQNPALTTSMQQNEVSLDEVVTLIGEATKQAVDTEFVAVKKFNHAMSELAAFAVSRGIDPIITLNTGHEINLGLYERKIDKGLGEDLRTGEAGFINVGGVETAVRRNTIDPEGGQGDKLKAASQAGVLGTHGNDGINVGMTMNAMEAKLPQGNVAGQIFDGIMMPPKYAAQYSQQLNNDFYQLNEQFKAAMFLMEAIEKRLGPRARIPTNIRREVNRIENMRKQLFKRMKSVHIKQFFWD